MSLIIKHKDVKKIVFPALLLSSAFLWGQKAVNDTAKVATKDIDEVVIIGYGSVKKSDLTGSVSSVSAKDLAATPAMNALQALQGRAAGLNIVTAGGAPGAGANVTVRGGASITQGTEPLYIVDGFQLDNALNIINPNDIESIDVLKGASAIAIYGARGSNGIIVIKTKSGKKGKTTINYNSFMAFDMLSKKLDMVSNSEDYVKYQYELAQLNSARVAQWSNIFDNSLGTDSPGFYTGVFNRINNRYASAPALDWQEKMLGGTGMTQNQNVNISVGNEKTQAFISYNYNDQQGLLTNFSDKRNSLRANINSELFKGIRVDFGSMFTSSSTNGGGAYSGMKKILLQPITGGTKFTQDQLFNTQTYGDFSALDSAYDTENPFVETRASTSNKRARAFVANAGLEIDFLKNFTFRTAGQYSWSNSKSTSFADENSRSFLTDLNTGINGSIGNSENYRYQITNTVTYNKTFAEKHKITALIGQEAIYSESESNSMKLIKFPVVNFGLDDLTNATVSEKDADRSSNSLSSYFGRVNYNYDDRYLLTATIRRDGSSKFGPKNKYGNFPSVAAAWRLSQESFWKNGKVNNFVNDIKFRFEYGITGNNDIGNSLYTTNLVLTDYPSNNTPGNPAYTTSNRLGNPYLKWEEMESTNIGLDLALFNNRIKLTSEWYNNNVSDMLLDALVPVSSGYARQQQNIGTMRNRGMEFTLNTINVKSESFRWSTDANIGFNKSKVRSLEDGQTFKPFSVGSSRSGLVTYYATVGEQLGDMYGYVYQGIYTTDDFTTAANGTTLVLKPGVVKPSSGTPKPGDMKFAADNAAGDQFTRKLVKIGNGTPDFIGGISNNVSYKGFDLAVFMKFSVGGDIYNATKQSLSPYALFQNVPTEFGNNFYHLIDPNTGQATNNLARLKELNPNENASLWSLSNTNTTNIAYPSSYYVEDGSYLRIAQLTVGYSLNKEFLQHISVANARLYVTVNNLATITGYSGYDPEVSAAGGVAVTPGYDTSSFPRSRSYVLGINLTF